MPFINFPANLTDEEEILLKKYAKLKKKLQKKELQAQKSNKSDTNKPAAEATKRSASEAGAEEAKEQAKKLLKSGAIKLDESREKQFFKRSKHSDKKLKDSTDKAAMTFQPFTSQYDDGDDEATYALNRLFQRTKGEGRMFRRERAYRDPPPKRGNTVYIRGQGITEDIATRLFSKYGTIQNITIEPNSNCGFITFESMDSSDRAIQDLNDIHIPDLFSSLQVSIARRQPIEFTPGQSDQVMATSWSSIAASESEIAVSSHKEVREIVSYNENDDIFS